MARLTAPVLFLLSPLACVALLVPSSSSSAAAAALARAALRPDPRRARTRAPMMTAMMTPKSATETARAYDGASIAESYLGVCADVCVSDPSSSSSSAASSSTSLSDAVLLIDAENVRGKSGFEMSHGELLDRVSLWTSRRCELRGRVTLVIDHGSARSACWLPGRGIAIIFAGPCIKADDVIARDAVPYHLSMSLNAEVGRDVVVVTGDGELCHRCRSAAATTRDASAAAGQKVRILPPVRFLAELESLELSDGMLADGGRGCDGDGKEKDRFEAAMLQLREEGDLARSELKAEIVRAEANMRRQSSPKKRRRHLKQLRVLRERLAASMLSSVTDAEGGASAMLIVPDAEFAAMSRDEHDALLMRWSLGRDRSGRKRRETTAEREVLAEALREELEQVVDEGGGSRGDGAVLSPVEAYVLHMNAAR